MIELKDIYKFNLKGINFRIGQGDWLTIAGHNGAGKTTILRLIYGIITPDKGSIILLDNKLKKNQIKNKVGFISQESGIIENKNVFSNLALPLKLSRKYSKSKVDALIDKLGLSDFAKLKASDLPASRRQLLKIGIAISKDPLLLLADEPTEHLDAEKSDLVLSLLYNLHSIGTTIVFTTSKSIPEHSTKKIHLKNGEIISVCSVEKEQNA